MRESLLRLYRDLTGTTAIEYAMIASLIALVVFSVTQQIGTSVSGFFGQIANSF